MRKRRTFAALLLRPPDARGTESVGLEARRRGREGLLPEVQAPSKASEALTYDDNAGKQREKNGERLTDEQNQTRPMDMSVLQGEWVVDTFYPYWTFADGTA